MSQFREYVTSTAFLLSLTKSQIVAIEAMVHLSWQPDAKARVFDTAALWQLVRKGIVDTADRKKWRLTREGMLVVRLLHAAGLLEVDTEYWRTFERDYSYTPPSVAA